jgi:hypothetical protein
LESGFRQFMQCDSQRDAFSGAKNNCQSIARCQLPGALDRAKEFDPKTQARSTSQGKRFPSLALRACIQGSALT